MKRTLLSLLICICTTPLFAVDAPKVPAEKPKKPLPRWLQMDYGPFLSLSITDTPNAKYDNNTGFIAGDVVPRGLLIKLADDWSTGIVFDMDLCRLAYTWTGAPPRWRGIIFDGEHGLGTQLGASPTFKTPYAPGWADSTGSFKDPRPDIIKPLAPPGPLPRAWAKYKGLYRHADRIILSYTVGQTPILEMPSLESPALESSASAQVFTRTFHISPSTTELLLSVAQSKGEASVENKILTTGNLHIAAAGAPPGSKLELNPDNNIIFRIPPHTTPLIFKLLLSTSSPDSFPSSPKPLDLTTLTHGGPAQYPQTITTKGILSTSKDPYVVDNLTLPTDNPWRSWIRPGGFDFFADGTRAALCTWSGDVWILSGIDDTLQKLTWKRFATGLHQPLGLKIVNDIIYTVGHDQITRFHDLNNDGEADFYENFNNDWELTSAFHAFCFDLQTDPDGNFFFAFGSPVRAGGPGFHNITSHHGSILKVSKDGSKLERYATGFRAPNGMCVSPTGQVTIGDNEGSWVPKSPLHWIKPGSFNGVVTSAHMPLKSIDAKADISEMPKPLCWFPKNYDNSAGGQVWVTSDNWGPFKGDLLHMSYGTSSLFKVLKEEVNGQVQGGVVKFPLRFTSSAMRARFNPKDGQLYIAGLSGWQSNAARDGGLDRVRYTNKPVSMPTSLRATKTGLRIAFTCLLDSQSVMNPDNYSVEIWNYKWSSTYGSGDYSTLPDSEADPKAKKKADTHDTLTVKRAYISDDGRELFLEIPDIRPANQMKITMKLKTPEGKPLNTEISNTIHNLGTQ
ncbi:MAG TPA: DUF6797 domain-containing protein [Tepidisphaeraceae bacterium]|nr:DUF6797 domain-containing protein [Tepidisphaeraceae bacterium]